MPEEQVGAVYGSGDGSFVPVNYAKESTNGAVSGLNGLSSSIFMTADSDLCVCGQPGSARSDGGEPGQWQQLSAEPSGHLPGEREPGRVNGSGICGELELRLLPGEVVRGADDQLLRGIRDVAESGCGLRAAERAGVVPFPDAEPGSRGRDRHVLRGAAGIRPAGEGGVLW